MADENLHFHKIGVECACGHIDYPQDLQHETCKGCGYDICVGWEDETVIDSITVDKEGSKVKNGDMVCDICLTENLCGRCGMWIDEYGMCRMCTGRCHRMIGLGTCDCVSISWKRNPIQVICKDCIILQPKEHWQCETCKKDIREELSHRHIVPDVDKVICEGCVTHKM